MNRVTENRTGRLESKTWLVAAWSVALGLVLLIVLSDGSKAGSLVETAAAPAAVSDYPRRYLRQGVRPGSSDAAFWLAVMPDSGGMRPLTRVVPGGYCVLIFTSPFKANEYIQRADDLPASMRMVAWNAARCATELRELRAQQITSFTLDPAICAEQLAMREIKPSLDEAALLKLWESFRGLSLNVGRKHYTRLLETVRAGEYQRAAPDIEDALQCVIPEEPRFSLLLGACGVGLGDSSVVDRALRNLAVLDPPCADVLQREASDMSHLSPAARKAAAKRILALIARVTCPLL